MIASSSTRPHYARSVVDVKGPEFARIIESADAFICAAGFEARAEKVPLAAKVKKNPLIVTYADGPAQNSKTLKNFVERFAQVPGYDTCQMKLSRIERFEADFEASLTNLRNLDTGKIVLDMSGLPNFAICTIIIKVRQVFPSASLTILYTEADEYFPRKGDFERLKRGITNRTRGFPREFLSARAVTMFLPSMFTGMALGHNDTCLIVFAGYEPHRTNCVIDSTNPSKLVMVYGEPGRADLRWRHELSRLMHRSIETQLMRTEEVTSTCEIDDNLALVLNYYDYLYDDHVLCVCPTNSKMQAVACALAWEIYPDIQLNFPIPAEYLPKRFSVDSRETFVIDLGVPPTARRFLS